MFTGIVEELGSIETVLDRGDSLRLEVRARAVLEGTTPGDSIAVDGCCLTVVEVAPEAGGLWAADVMRQTLERTSLRRARPGDRVNLERAVTPRTRLGGHLVQGHVDDVGTVVARTPAAHWEMVDVAVPERLRRYLVPQGSVAVDGVSLTVAALTHDGFTVSLVPETLSRTTLGFRRPGDPVNIEVDVIAKYVEKMLEGYRP